MVSLSSLFMCKATGRQQKFSEWKCRGLTGDTYKSTSSLCIKHPKLMRLSQNWTQDLLHCRGTLEHSNIRTALIIAIRNLALYYYRPPPHPPPSCDVASSWLGIIAEFNMDADIFDKTRGGPNSERGSKALEPLLLEREQGHVRIASRWGQHYVGAWPEPPTSSA